MINYKKYIKMAIERRDYQLENMKNRINCLRIDGKLFNENKEGLLQLMEDA